MTKGTETLFDRIRQQLDRYDERLRKERSPIAGFSVAPDDLRALLDAAEGKPITREHALRAAQNAVRNQGYAVAVHGSQVKDLDLIAVPWRDTALSAQDVAELIAEAIPGFIEKGSPEAKPHGRLSFTIRPNWHFGFDHWWIDLAVMPRDCDWTIPVPSSEDAA
jgi:hypothetical protein